MLGARLNGLELPRLILGQRAGQPHQQSAGKADDGIQGCAQLVRHSSEESILCLAGILQLKVLRLQSLLESFALGDISNGAGHQGAIFCFREGSS